MKTLHSLIAGLRPAISIVARRVTLLPLLFAGLMLVQPCAGQSGTWTATGSLNTARHDHTATLLSNGQVLVVAEVNAPSSEILKSAELYDPATGTWTATGSLANERGDHTATLLPSGKVLVAGGDNDFHPALASAKLYDPATGTWTATGSLVNARWIHTATLLPNGKVLVAGGYDENYTSLASAELYDPAAGTWTATGSLATARAEHTATLLPNGQVLVAAGIGVGGFPPPLASVELYDPAAGTWTATGSLITARTDHTATLLLNGKALAAGGVGADFASLASAELYTPPAPTSYRDVILGDNPIMYWRFGETSGTIAYDESANHRDARYLNNVGLGVPGAIAGDPNTAAGFHGIHQYVKMDSYVQLLWCVHSRGVGQREETSAACGDLL